MLDDLGIFIEVVSSGSISGASKKLGIHQSQISRSIKKLEAMFNVSLLYRDSRRMISTEYGRLLYDSVHSLYTQVNLAIDNYEFLVKDYAGTLNIIAPLVFVEHFITPNLEEFLKKYPNLKVFISTDYNNIDEYNNPFDLAISVEYPTKESFVVKKYFTSKPVLCAEKSYAEQHQAPVKIDDIDKHNLIVPQYIDRVALKWFFYNEESGKITEKEIMNYQLSLSSIILIKQMIMDGYGIAPMLDFNVYKELQKGDIVRVLPDYHLKPFTFYLVRPNKFKNIKVEAFLHFLNNQIAHNSALVIES